MNKKLDIERAKEGIQRRKGEVYKPVVPDMQLGFVHHNVDCIGCRACEIACKDKNGFPPGPRFRRVMFVEGGTYPDVYPYKVNVSCNHCSDPACLPACPTGAIWKRKQDGIVDIDSTLCIGCRRCEATCPYGAPQWNPQEQVIKKCNLCVDEIEGAQALLRHGVHDARARRRPDRSTARRDLPDEGNWPR
jgi:anaerobic dimethyl sulfoxide reductase subunit B (iron-sulfur subunit)